MDEEVNPSSGLMLPVALALLGVALGGAGLYFGFTANQRLSPLQASVREESSRAAGLEDDLEGASTRIAELSARLDDLERTLERTRAEQRRSASAAQQLVAPVKENRRQIVTIAEKYNTLADRLASPQPSAAERESDGSGAAASGGSETPAGGASENGGAGGAAAAGAATHTVRAGDTFARIAKEKGVSLGALMEANPDTDPRRLRIGQTLNLPEE